MLEDFFFYFRIGMEHVLELGALDHILFLVCLCIPLALKDWQKTILLVSFFTVGHTLSLLLGAFGVLTLNSKIVEFLIPFTILIAAIINIITAGKLTDQKAKVVYGFAVFFGIIHGLAYYGDLKMVLFGEGKLTKIIEISLGVEAAQLIIAFILLILAFVAQQVLKISKRDWIIVVSALAAGLIMPMIAENKFW